MTARSGGFRMKSQPTVLVRMADAGDLYLSWQWEGESGAPEVACLPEDQVVAALRRLADALPDPAEPGGLERALSSGAFASIDAEYDLAQTLSRALLPARLAGQMHDLFRQGIRPHLRVQPSPRVAQVPWELIAPHPELRLIDIADISLLAPAAIVADPARKAPGWAQTRELPVVAVLDPRIPGFRADSPLGSVLGRPDNTGPLAQRISAYMAASRLVPNVSEPAAAFRRTDLDRTWLSAALRRGVSRLLYVGHVTAAPPESGQSENAELHLCCSTESPGFAQPTRTHRPLSAKDLLLGTHTLAAEPVAGHELWPMPSRVALIACESGGDLRFTEAIGLVAALLSAGAQLVTATRWPLPTDHALHRIAGLAPDQHPLQRAICAIDSAHEQPDPIATLADWHREQLARWRKDATMDHSPLLWSAFATIAT
ncbi:MULTISPECIES: CHAT domain-containing protein [unclassified Nocardia]|uniref:CHAT domain-containing protein n=1 Tax=unclassified Nocardia TaxID=2637762 RepID=UPI001CE49B41|nr:MULTISPECIES: CHAT domain-containing protein [unclassified Nocardia]